MKKLECCCVKGHSQSVCLDITKVDATHTTCCNTQSQLLQNFGSRILHNYYLYLLVNILTNQQICVSWFSHFTHKLHSKKTDNWKC